MKQILNLPESISVRIARVASGAVIAELPEYNAHTEADNLFELQFMVNDLIYCIFNVPSALRKNVKYLPSSSQIKTSPQSFLKFVSQDRIKSFC